MIRSSALLTVAAMALLVAGVTSASLRIIYLSIAVSILAAVTLGAGVVLRRRELFGHPEAAAAQPDGTAAMRPADAGRVPGGQSAASGGTDDDRPGRAQQDGDLAERISKAATGAGSGRWPWAIAAKGAPVPGHHGGGSESQQASSGPPAGEAAVQPEAAAPAQDTGSVWSAWARVRASHTEQEPASTGRDRGEPVGGAEAEEPGSGATGKDLPEDGPAERGPADRGQAEGTGPDAEPSPPEAEAAAPGAAGQETEDAGVPAEPRSALNDEVTIVPGVARYHRRGCLLIRFLGDGDMETMTRREAEAAGSVPCKACQAAEPGPAG